MTGREPDEDTPDEDPRDDDQRAGDGVPPADPDEVGGLINNTGDDGVAPTG